ncbi:ATP-binding protein [Pontiella agarivorans]|uniref:ATP-binding protein n=1 Tax=Pontiella agarivorans TaxID=3038953 RepID=A0ABU5MVA3_9BACT|nr:ATP-binding protein [Pontiella agarivorans]MDZ8118095.1 ATP-binding protein [Pontiella agarivorans]
MSLSTYHSKLTLENLRLSPENQYLERKGRDTKPTKIANELIGMLNAGGGTLVYGIADDGTIEDLAHVGGLLPNEPTKLDAYRKLVHEFIKPPANIQLEEIYLESGELIFLFHVDQDYERVFQRSDNEEVYLRVADSNNKLNRDEVKKLEYDKAIRSFEDEIRLDFDPLDLDRNACEDYRTTMSYEGSFEDLAIKRNLAIRREGQVLYKNASILLFSTDPEKYIPNASVRYVRHEGMERKSGSAFNVVKDVRLESSIPKLIQELETFMEASLRDYYYLNMDTGKFHRLPEFPKEAWLEGIVNALCHRSYNLQGNPVMIRHFDDRLEISNSGPLPAQVTVENIAHERYSRNPRIARALADMGYVRELNEGVPRIYSSMQEVMLAKPEYTDTHNTVTLTLRNKVSDHKETILGEVLDQVSSMWKSFNPSQKQIISILFECQEATVDQLEDSMELTKQSVRYNLRYLLKIGVLERVSEKERDPQAIYRFRSG